jgi:dTDP-4-amino-4,6-dideoxygalactose transaminase
MSGDRLAIFGGRPTLDRASHRTWPILGEDERRAAVDVLERGILSGASAPESVAFEREFAAWVGAQHALLTHSGTSALHLALAASGIAAGDHVLVPAYSFVATPLAVLHCGAIPIFVDVDEATGLMDSALATAAVTPRTRAIMPVHVHGCAAALGPLLAIGIPIVEDAAQAHGATWNDRRVGAIGRAGGFSLQASKNLGAGEGGVFVTNDAAIAEQANRIRNFGQDVALADVEAFDAQRPLDGARSLTSARLGWMYRGNELTAAIARAQLARLDHRTEKCQGYAAALSLALAELPGVLPPQVPSGSTSVHHKFRVRLDPELAGVDVPASVLRDVMITALRAEGLEVVTWQTTPLPGHPIFRQRDGFGGGWPWSADRDTDFEAAYDVARFPRTQRLLDGSLVLFSQSCPLIAQGGDIVARYAEAFTRVWERRDELAASAKRG